MDWITIKNKRNTWSPDPWPMARGSPPREEKINEPCWFYNTVGCKNKDGSEKTQEECKYLHIFSNNSKRPSHLIAKKPCDKFNLEGSCKWGECCKYSHKRLDPEEWSKHYPQVPYSMRTNIEKYQMLENKLIEMEGRIKILEYKIKCMDERSNFSSEHLNFSPERFDNNLQEHFTDF